MESHAVKEEKADEFYFWLSRLLLREGRLRPTVRSFEQDFGLSSVPFQDAFTFLKQAFQKIKNEPEPALGFQMWAKYLRYSYGRFKPDEELFVKHTYLSAIARLLVWAAFSQGKCEGPLGETVRSVLNGGYFQEWRIENLSEKDFYFWLLHPKVERDLTPVWTRIVNHMLTYDLAQINQDILKGVYQELVDEITRHGLGEYYTPEWLCERMVKDLLPKEGIVKVLDPACGSGSFLRATLSHFLKNNRDQASDKRLNDILESVVGLDINPLAVLISKATYALAISELIKEVKRPIQIPIYLADTLFLPKEVRQYEFGGLPLYEIGFGSKSVKLPESLVTSPRDFDIAISCCCKVAIDLARRPDSEDKESLRNFLLKEDDLLRTHPELKQIIDGLWDFTEELADLIKVEKNTIWSYIVRNNYRPCMLGKKFDIIIGNPPWLSYRYIEDLNYQAEVKKLGLKEYKVAPKKQRLMTQMEIAAIFLIHSISAFGVEDASRLGFVMPRGIFNADQHELFRSENFTADEEVLKYWDLREVKPLSNVPACVAFLKKQRERSPKSEYPVLEFRGRLPEKDLPWSEARKYLEMDKGILRRIYLGKRSALSTKSGWTKPTRRSRYGKRFRQGATIVPRNFYFLEFMGDVSGLVPEKLYLVKTNEEEAKESKRPYDKIRMKGQVEGRFLGYTALAKHLLPFCVLPPALIALPVVEHAVGHYGLVTSDRLRRKGYRYMASWILHAETVWNEKRGAKAEKQDLYARLDYSRELTSQSPNNTYLVLYNAAGTHVAAAYFDTRNLDSWFIVEHKLYWFACDSPKEGHYLTAVLNSTTTDERIKPFQSVGLMGERDIEKKLLDLPIPIFDRKSPIHNELAKLGRKASQEAAEITPKLPGSRALGMRREAMRRALCETISRIDYYMDRLLKSNA